MPAGLPKSLSPTVIDNVLTICKMGFTQERGKTFEFPTPAMARSARQSIYEVRRSFASSRHQPDYKALFECHMQLKDNTLHIGPHPLSLADMVTVCNFDGSDKRPFVELAIELESRALEYTKKETKEVEVDLSLMEKFIFGALLAQAIGEIFQERNIHREAQNQKNWNHFKPLARKRALQYLLESRTPDKNKRLVQDYYNEYMEEFLVAQKDPEDSRILYGEENNSSARKEVEALLASGPIQLDLN